MRRITNTTVVQLTCCGEFDILSSTALNYKTGCYFLQVSKAYTNMDIFAVLLLQQATYQYTFNWP